VLHAKNLAKRINYSVCGARTTAVSNSEQYLAVVNASAHHLTGRQWTDYWQRRTAPKRG
jgi:hypothetical protein